jgi:ferredoxin
VNAEKNTIIFRLSYDGTTNVIQTHKDQYDSLMCLISEYLNISRFGVCYGGGSCKTCGVILKESHNFEKKFVLACEVKIDDELANKSVIIL